MRARRLTRGLLPPVALLVLVATLGTLQYRWLGRVSEAEREQLRVSLDRRAREFADDFDREITRLHQGLQPATPFNPETPAVFAERYDRWLASAAAPSLVKGVYFAKPSQAGSTLYRYDPAARAFAVTDWPAAFEPVRTRLSGTIEETPTTGSTSTTRVIAFTTSSVVAEVPAVVIALPANSDVMLPRMTAPGSSGRIDHDLLMALRMSHSHLVVELDEAYLSKEVLPALIARHFGDSGGVPYRVAIVDMQSRTIASRNIVEGDRIDPSCADATAPFFTVRPESVRSATLTWTAPVDPKGAKGTVVMPRSSVTSQVTAVAVHPMPEAAAGRTGGAGAGMVSPIGLRTSSGHWRLLVQHGAGSLDAAVAAARRRNLWLSFGILAVLAASVGLIVVNARRSERLAAQQMDFVATVSHELRTPLAVIRSAAQNLSAGVVHEPAQARRYGELIESEGRRLTEMVEQVLEYAGLEAHRQPLLARPMDPGGLVSDVVSSCSALFDAAGFDVTVTVAPNLPPVAADEGPLRRALTNLLMNAVKHAASGRSVVVDVQAVGAREGREVQIAVTDRGPGIAAGDLAHIFEPFYRGRQATEGQIHGNGLGLSLVKRITEAHGGRVTVKSAPDAGATFTIHLPAVTAEAAPQPFEAAAEAGGQAR